MYDNEALKDNDDTENNEWDDDELDDNENDTSGVSEAIWALEEIGTLVTNEGIDESSEDDISSKEDEDNDYETEANNGEEDTQSSYEIDNEHTNDQNDADNNKTQDENTLHQPSGRPRREASGKGIDILEPGMSGKTHRTKSVEATLFHTPNRYECAIQFVAKEEQLPIYYNEQIIYSGMVNLCFTQTNA